MKGNALKFLITASVLVLLAAPSYAQVAGTAVQGAGSTTGTSAQAPATPPLPDPTQAQAENPANNPADPPTPPSEELSQPDTLKDQGTQTTSGAECVTSLSEITKIREPEFSTGNVWDIVYSEGGMDVFADAVPLENDEIVAGGAFTKDPEDKIYHPLLVKYDERLKPVWEVRTDTKELQTIHRIIKTKDGFTVLGDMNVSGQGAGIYIGSYDNDGKVKGKPAPLFEAGGDLDAKAFVQASDGSGYVIAAQFIDSKDQEKQYGILYKISRAGKQVWKRTFKTGRSTVFNNVQATLDGNYAVTGQIVMEGNKSGGWLLKVDQNGAIQWQRTYPRGVAASLQAAGQTKEGEFILTGKTRPFDYQGKGLGAWVMKTDSIGNPLWQRFFVGAYTYEAPDLVVYEDGRASVLVNGGALDSQRRSHARLITFSPLGQIHHLEDFTEGQNAASHRLVSGLGGERILVGYTQTSFGEKQETNEAGAAPDYTFDGWLMAASPLDLYEDPCKTKPSVSPILP
ncbi:MAG: hypothetical protein DI551_04160 [Micavibrio aeruginosavorus]|uniref:Lipoprotein n=1 Tax=Micavibrio aeruginosavorus TaxID=349221 RepID=A0A2W5N0G7_9BACT|nr:MAG: hypothetical protein DI551_04160 [Micavibrio aeruginosavorus]